ncbi:hypothetical protein K503DRAFT_775504, partial [Rhizopogon vinicolor AM-OR11-026]
LEQLTAVDPSCLLKDQRHAYDIINWHLTETPAGRAPLQLLMHSIPGEGRSHACQGCIVYTGIAASIIDDMTLHVIAQVPVNGNWQFSGPINCTLSLIKVL